MRASNNFMGSPDNYVLQRSLNLAVRFVSARLQSALWSQVEIRRLLETHIDRSVAIQCVWLSEVYSAQVIVAANRWVRLHYRVEFMVAKRRFYSR